MAPVCRLRQKWLILTTMVLAAVAAVLYLNNATPMYSSTATLYVQQLSVAIGPNGGSEGPQRLKLPGDSEGSHHLRTGSCRRLDAQGCSAIR